MAMQPGIRQPTGARRPTNSSQFAGADLAWEAMSPKRKRESMLKNALAQGQQTGDFSIYQKLVWDALSPEQQKRQMLEQAQKRYMAKI